VQACALMWVAGLVHAKPSGAKLTFLTYPGTGKADIKINEFMAGLAPMRQAVEKASERALYVTMVRRIQEFEAALADKSRQPMLVYGPATSAAKYMDAGYIPLVRVEKFASGMVVSKKPLGEVYSVVCPDPMSWLAQVGSYAVKATLRKDVLFSFTSTQDAALWSVQTGMADAAVVRESTLKKMQEKDSAYRSVITLPATPDFTLLAHPTLEPVLQTAIRSALEGLSSEAIQSLDGVYHVKTGRFVPALPKEYDELRRIVSAVKFSNE
jgi:hypothetical protein